MAVRLVTAVEDAVEEFGMRGEQMPVEALGDLTDVVGDHGERGGDDGTGRDVSESMRLPSGVGGDFWPAPGTRHLLRDTACQRSIAAYECPGEGFAGASGTGVIAEHLQAPLFEHGLTNRSRT
ncbi:hypothetical protein GCM10027162_36430 [Streptomyces incanus]